MSTLSPEERTLRARAAAFAKHAKHDPDEHLARARAALWDKYRRQVDPDGTLDEAERDRRAACAMQSDLALRRLKAARSRTAATADRLADELLAVGGDE